MRTTAAFPLILVALAGAAPRDGETRLKPPQWCDLHQPRRAQGETPPRAQRLDRLPQGNLSLAVLRRMGGCPQPTIIREGFGAAPFRR